MAKRSTAAAQFLQELMAFTEDQRRLIEASCDGFSPDETARAERRARVFAGDYRFFFYTYFPHYSSTREPSVFHEWCFDNLPSRIDAPRGKRVNISAPRGEAKSTLVTQVFSLLCIIRQSKHYIPIVMDSQDQAQMMLEAIKVELTDNPRLAMDFPEHVGKGRVWNVGVALTATDIKLQAFGSGKRMRGMRHGPYRPDLVLLDDIENDENVQQKAQRDKLERWLKKVVMPLGPPDGSMDILYLNTILHYDGVANRVHNSPLWESVKFRAIIEWPDRLDLWQRWEELFLNEGEDKADRYYAERKVEMDAGAVVSWPSMRPLVELMKLRANDHHAFDCEYQNDPSNDDGAPFHKIHFWVQPAHDWIFFGAHDPSMGKFNKGRDPSATLVGGLSRATGVLDVVEAIVSRRVPDVQIIDITRLQEEYRCLVWGIETVQFQEFFKDELVKRSRAGGVPVPARGVKPGDDKDLRILSLQPHVVNGTVRSHPKHTVLNEQLRYYPEAAHDDGPDALQILFMLAYSGFGRVIPRVITGKRKAFGHGA
ncbi:hypothetical protein EM868_00395 [Cupriavidus gilardii]|uniref:phage terminase large subunit n=1 Tax=Cupriavidus gilardii TaxID=82541 RepID=UPI001EE626F0|nr:phage terminase large subunit [Cupriavidus gilardii]MCG5260412.1 phage terminase large subunit [Cupriavidus gilardii]MDF9428262.1 hypothetical protein [Cupriavidus gilardii]